MARWVNWWKRLAPNRQDRYALLGPLVSVGLFVIVTLVAFLYLRAEEVNRESEAMTRDLEYAQQRLRLRLLERQEQLMRMARHVTNREANRNEFELQAENLVNQFPELV